MGLSPNVYNNPRMVTINGERKDIPSGTTLAGILNSLSLRPEQVAIELNRAIVKRDRWNETVVADGSEIEIVQFVGGG